MSVCTWLLAELYRPLWTWVSMPAFMTAGLEMVKVLMQGCSAKTFVSSMDNNASFGQLLLVINGPVHPREGRSTALPRSPLLPAQEPRRLRAPSQPQVDTQ